MRSEEADLDPGEFSDEQLVLLFAHGRESAFDDLFHRYADRVHRIALRMVGSRLDAEEIVQEVFLRVARAAPSWEPRARFRTWLDRVAVNRSLTHRERRGQGRVVLLPGLEQLAADTRLGPFEEARERELAESLRSRVAELPDALAAAFTLCVLEGTPTAEAAEVLDLPTGTVKTHVHRARLLLRRRMARELEDAGRRSEEARP